MSTTHRGRCGSAVQPVKNTAADHSRPKAAMTQADYARQGQHKGQRSAVTNGKRLHVKAPGDTAWARRFRDIFKLICDDVTAVNTELSEGQRQLARRAATISIECERLEGLMAAGDGEVEVDMALYGTLTDRLGRTLERLGLRRARHNGNTYVINGKVEVAAFSPLQHRLRNADSDVIDVGPAGGAA